MVELIRKAGLPLPEELPEPLREAALAATSVKLREPRPTGFPLLFTDDLRLIEPALAFLHKHAVQRAHTEDTVRTYAEILYDWFETLEQNGIDWADVDGSDLIAYRSRMLLQPSEYTGRAYSVRTVNARVRGILSFYEWLVRCGGSATHLLPAAATLRSRRALALPASVSTMMIVVSFSYVSLRTYHNHSYRHRYASCSHGSNPL